MVNRTASAPYSAMRSQRLGGVAERLRHLPSLLVPDKRREVDVAEGNVFFARFASGEPRAELQPRHDHACNPEEDNVGRRDERVGRVEVPQIVRLPRPGFQGPVVHGERPEPGGEPRVEDIFVLSQRTSRRNAGSDPASCG